ITNLWDLEESPTLRLVGAYLDGVADAMAGLVQQQPSTPAAPPLPQSQTVEIRVETMESAVESTPTESSTRHITLRFGEVALPVEAAAWPRSAGDHLEPLRGGCRLLDLEHP